MAEKIFIKIAEMSITGCYVILAVIAVRLLLKKMPKRYSYAHVRQIPCRLKRVPCRICMTAE